MRPPAAAAVAAGACSSVTPQGGSATTYTFDVENRLKAGGTPSGAISYTYDGNSVSEYGWRKMGAYYYGVTGTFLKYLLHDVVNGTATLAGLSHEHIVGSTDWWQRSAAFLGQLDAATKTAGKHAASLHQVWWERTRTAYLYIVLTEHSIDSARTAPWSFWQWQELGQAGYPVEPRDNYPYINYLPRFAP